MFKYMTKNKAKELGFTHYGSLYCIPIYMTLEETPMISVKWSPMEYLMDLAEAIKYSCGNHGTTMVCKGEL